MTMSYDSIIYLGTRWKKKRNSLVYVGEVLYEDKGSGRYWLSGKKDVVISEREAMEWLRKRLVKKTYTGGSI